MTCGATPLSRLPNELFELVLLHCDFEAIAALRRTSKANAARCMSPAYQAYFSHQQTDLSEKSMERLQNLASHPQLGPAVTHLTVIAVCYDTIVMERLLRFSRRLLPDSRAEAISIIAPHIRTLSKLRQSWLMRSDEDIARELAIAFERLPSLRALSLSARVVQRIEISDSSDKWSGARVQEANARGTVDWIALWADCGRVFNIVTHAVALGHSDNTMIESLSIFDGCFGKVTAWKYHPRYLQAFQSHSLKPGFLAAAAKLTVLALGFSTTTLPSSVPASAEDILKDPEMRGYNHPTLLPADTILGAMDMPAVAEFLRLCTHLETLTLHMYNTLNGLPIVYEQVFDNIADKVRLPKLQRLTLRGMWCTPPAMLRFLRAHPSITELNFQELHLLGPMSSWDRIFVDLKQRMRSLSKVYLENLFYGAGKLLPLDPKDPNCSSASDQHFLAKKDAHEIVYARHIGAAELQKGIELAASTAATPISTRGKKDKAMTKWLKQRKVHYGPPKCPRELL